MKYSVKSLMGDLVNHAVNHINPLSKDIYIMICKDHYPKKIKIFLWELSLGPINMTIGCNGECLTCTCPLSSVLCATLVMRL